MVYYFMLISGDPFERVELTCAPCDEKFLVDTSTLKAATNSANNAKENENVAASV